MTSRLLALCSPNHSLFFFLNLKKSAKNAKKGKNKKAIQQIPKNTKAK
jgi:hypothetical protein